MYASSRADAALVEHIQAPLPHSLGESESFPMKLKKASLFDPSRALALLHHLHVQGMPAGKTLLCQICTLLRSLMQTEGPAACLKQTPPASTICLDYHITAVLTGLDDHERLQLIAGMVNLTHAQQLSALGALLSILQEVWSLITGMLRIPHSTPSVLVLSILQSVCRCILLACVMQQVAGLAYLLLAESIPASHTSVNDTTLAHLAGGIAARIWGRWRPHERPGTA